MDGKTFDRGFTIVKDPRFKMDGKNHWHMRVELIPKRDKKRNTRGFVVARNEFGSEEWYGSFYQRMKKKGLTLKDYSEVILANKEGLWRLHPLRQQFSNGIPTSIPLRIDLSRDGWVTAKKTSNFGMVSLTRRLGKQFAQHDMAKEIIFKSDKMGMFTISPEDIKSYRLDNPTNEVYEFLENQMKENLVMNGSDNF